jgi:beta-N-acetylhexosaminidase
MSRYDQAKAALGELFIIGFSGKTLSQETESFISQASIGGVIFFAHNYESPAQIAELSNQVQACRKNLPLWVCVDHEGGRVQRFKTGFTRIPDALAISKTDSPKLAFDIAELMGKELAAVGVNVNFSPVTDINSNPDNPVIGVRAFGDNEEQVSKMATAVVRGHLLGGVVPCAKHFPGHGDTSEDSHFALPRVDTPLETLREREFKPFSKAFKAKCPMVMTAHVICAALDDKVPATFSKRVLQEVLRDELRFQKLIVSDDLEMQAVTDHFGAEEAPRLALEAGCDLLIYRSEAAARHAYESVLKALDEDRLAPEVILEAARRSQEVKKEFLGAYRPVDPKLADKVCGQPAGAELVAKVPPLA